MKILVKLGGALLDSPESRSSLAAQIADAAAAHGVVVVHGGGKQMTRFLGERGVESKFVDGLRVTTPAVLDAVVKVVAGSVNQELVAALIAAGAKAAGLSGVDGGICLAERMREDLGFVGKPIGSDPALLELLIGNGYVPAVACVAGDCEGNIYNINADQMAVATAIGLRVDRLLFLTDVDGVRIASGQVAHTLTTAEAAALIDQKVATGGMQAKLNAATHAIREGVGEVVIAPGAAPGVLARLLAGEALGTRLIGG